MRTDEDLTEIDLDAEPTPNVTVTVPPMDDTPIDVQTAADDPPKPAKTPSIPPEAGIEALKKQLADETAARTQETARREAADRARQAAEAATHAARTEVHDTQSSLLVNAAATVKQSIDVSKRAYADAMAASDWTAAADAQAEMSTLAAKLVQLDAGIEQLKNAPKPQPPQTVDRTEQLARAMESQGSPRSAGWIRSHPEYATDGVLNQRLLAAHNLAVTDGLRPDSDEYFAAVEGTLRIRKPASDIPDADNPLSAAATPVRPPAAPVSRGSGGNGSAPRTIRLSTDQLEVAAACGMTPQEYGRQLLAEQERSKGTLQ